MTEKEYRARKELSYSSVKLFDKDRIKFYKKEILKDKSQEEEKTTALILGSLVDCLLFSKKDFEDKFKIATCVVPTGQMADFVEALCTLTLKCLNDDLVLTRELTDLMQEAFNNVKYNTKGEEIAFKKKDFAWLVTNFVGSEAEMYYKECRSAFGKTVVDLNLLNAANKVIEELQECVWTKDVINPTGGSVEVIDQLAVLFDILLTDGTKEPFKAALDRIVINHETKTISPYDLKVSYVGEDFGYNYWKMKYYLQVASYDLALSWWIENVRPELKDYLRIPMQFIVASSNLLSAPLIFKTSLLSLIEGKFGFTLKSGKFVKGLIELIEDINWHKKKREWRNSRKVYENNGIMTLLPFEDIKTE